MPSMTTGTTNKLTFSNNNMTTGTSKIIKIKNPDEPASEKQINWLKSLVQARAIEGHTRATYQAEILSGNMKKGRASEMIDWLLTQPKESAQTHPTSMPMIPPVVGAAGDPGVYMGGSGKIYAAAKKTSSHFLAFRRLVATPGQKPTLIKVYSKAAITDINTGGHKMTLAEADAWGKEHQFNGMSFCLSCGKLLTAQESVDYGVGPVCRSKSVWA